LATRGVAAATQPIGPAIRVGWVPAVEFSDWGLRKREGVLEGSLTNAINSESDYPNGARTWQANPYRSIAFTLLARYTSNIRNDQAPQRAEGGDVMKKFLLLVVFVARNVKLVAYVHKEEPNTIYRLHRSKKDPTVFVYYEHYPSQAALDYHSKVVLPAFNKEFPRPEGLLARPIENDKYQLVFD
jgi:quinol monooxygenase YgiN